MFWDVRVHSRVRRLLDRRSVLNFFLFPFSLLYTIIHQIRVASYSLGILKTKRLPCRVISIGNITVGGTGKTPMVITIARALRDKGKKVAVLSRGYKGEKKGADEALLMTKRLEDIPVITGRDRYVSGNYAIDKYRVDTILLDDGFQHIQLKRNLDILLIDSTNPFGNGFTLPAGILREPIRNIKRADVIVLTRANQVEDINYVINRIKTYNPSAPIFKARHRPAGFIRLADGNIEGVELVKDKGILIFSGIGNPVSFSFSLSELGAKIIEVMDYPDHYLYDERDIKGIEKRAKDLSAEMIVTTEKDAMRLSDILLPDNLWALRIEMEIIDDRERWESFFLG